MTEYFPNGIYTFVGVFLLYRSDYRIFVGTGFHNGKYSSSGNWNAGIRHCFGVAVYSFRFISIVAEIYAEIGRLDECDQGNTGFP